MEKPAVIPIGRAPVSPRVLELAEAVGSSDDGALVVEGSGRFAHLGGPVAAGCRSVRAPAGVLDIRPEEMTVRVLAGTPVTDLDHALAEVGQCVALPAWPGHTVGGAIATGLSGIRRLGWGPVREVPVEMTIVLASGVVTRIGGPTVKNVSGFDVVRLLTGSLGTLAVIGEVVLRTRPLPTAERWFAGTVPPARVHDALYRPTALLWDGTTTTVLIGGRDEVVRAASLQAGTLGLREVDGPPELPDHRWNLRPSQIETLEGEGWVAEWGVGTVHHHRPAPAPVVDASVADLHARIKSAFDPTGRLAPGRSPLSAGDEDHDRASTLPDGGS